MKTAAIVALLLAAGAVYASSDPYCVAAPTGLECWYNNWARCVAAAEAKGVPCVVNPASRG